MEHRLSVVRHKVTQQQAISIDQARWLYQHATMGELGELANISRSHYHAAGQATYLLMAIINYTNICVAACDYCAFYRLPHQAGTYLLSFAELCERIDHFISLGGHLISFNGGFHPGLKISDYAALFDKIHNRYPHLSFFEMTVAEFIFACKLSKVSYEEGARLLKAAGTQWVTGGGAEILDDGFRARHSPGKFKVSEYYKAQKAILASGLGSTATMVIGFDESLEERLRHLESLRAFQEETGQRLPSFLCWTYKPWNNKLGGQEISNGEYLRWLAICRIYLHNFKHVRTSLLTRNEDGLLGLKYGADDFDLPTEDEVTQKAGATISLDFAHILQQATKLGITPLPRSPFSPSSEPFGLS